MYPEQHAPQGVVGRRLPGGRLSIERRASKRTDPSGRRRGRSRGAGLQRQIEQFNVEQRVWVQQLTCCESQQVRF